ncbi:unnamed protein product, partial [Symbiodinium sp. CCMP2456]
MFGVPERGGAGEEASHLEEGDEEELEELEDENGVEFEEPQGEDGVELDPEGDKPSEGQDLAEGPAEPAEEDFDPDAYADKVSPAGVAEICSSPEVAETKEDATKEDVDAKDRTSELRDRLRELKKKMVLKREDTQL